MKESKEDEFGIVGMFRSIQNAEGGEEEDAIMFRIFLH